MSALRASPHLGEGRLKDVEDTPRRALLVGMYRSGKEKDICKDHLDELEALCDTYGFTATIKLSTPLRKIEAPTFLGKGKVEEIAQMCVEEDIDIVIFDEEIAPHQQRNLEKICQRYVIDRTELILGVFEIHAKTKEAQIQVSLALYRYQLPRLKRLWTHLERQRIGGKRGGYLKGAGERQLEIDRRILHDRIVKLQKELQSIKKHREVQRKARKRVGIPTFAIIGYTNAGKSTLLNALTQASVLVEDKLFATLDTTTRKFILPNRQQILLIDTVGFIRKIPHTLVASFKSTLEEAIEADVLLHIVDVNSPRSVEEADTTFEVLKELGAQDRPIITLLNKVDLLKNGDVIKRFKIRYPKTVEISALKKVGFEKLIEMMMKELSKLRAVFRLKIPQINYALACELMKKGKVISCEYKENNIFLVAELPYVLNKRVAPFLCH